MTNAISKFINNGTPLPRGQTIDGHFWVERNGKIIDPLFPYIMLGGVREDNRVYHYATEDELFYVMDYVRYASEMLDKVSAVKGKWENKLGYCFCNAMAELWRNGGELKFGALGYKKTSTMVQWIYGHPENKMKDFISPQHAPPAHSGMTKLVRKGKGCKECDDC